MSPFDGGMILDDDTKGDAGERSPGWSDGESRIGLIIGDLGSSPFSFRATFNTDRENQFFLVGGGFVACGRPRPEPLRFE